MKGRISKDRWETNKLKREVRSSSEHFKDLSAPLSCALCLSPASSPGMRQNPAIPVPPFTNETSETHSIPRLFGTRVPPCDGRPEVSARGFGSRSQRVGRRPRRGPGPSVRAGAGWALAVRARPSPPRGTAGAGRRASQCYIPIPPAARPETPPPRRPAPAPTAHPLPSLLLSASLLLLR